MSLDDYHSDNEVAEENDIGHQMSECSLPRPITGVVRTSETGRGLSPGRKSSSNMVKESQSMRQLFDR